MIPPRTSSRGRRLVVTGRIATLGGQAGPGWVGAVAIDHGRVVAAADAPEVLAAFPGVRRLALAPDEVALPGLTDAHLHLAEAALARPSAWSSRGARRSMRSSGASGPRRPARPAPRTPGSRGPAGTRTRSRTGPRPTTSSGRRGLLVAVWAHDHRALAVSHRALAAAGIDRSTPDPTGGVIRRGPDGEATGVLHETATRLVAGPRWCRPPRPPTSRTPWCR